VTSATRARAAGEHLLALRVKPLHVIDEDGHRALRGGRIDQADRCEGD
jgi:hypothetical protein